RASHLPDETPAAERESWPTPLRWPAAYGASRDAHQPVSYGVNHQLSRVVDAERLHDIGAMHGNGVRAQTQQHRDVFVRFSVHDQLQNFQLARGQRARTVASIRLAQ